MYTILFQLMYSLAWTTLSMKTVLSINLWMEMFAKVFEKKPPQNQFKRMHLVILICYFPQNRF